MVSAVASWHESAVFDSRSRACLEFVCSLHVCVGFLQVLLVIRSASESGFQN